ncbi:MAG: UDP-N-acetylglucosamine 2-epimerase (non-hydrolyzing) [Planctomycetota bacterium]
MKFMVIFGTRPEAIKIIPVIRKLKESGFQVVICVTAQQREMLDQSLVFFGIIPDYDLNIMVDCQDLFYVTIKALEGLKKILQKERPDVVLVQGDTSTAFTASLAAFYLQISIGHIEAGLRTHNKYNPFPEEKNRHLVGVLADYHFAPTELARDNLTKEGIPESQIWVTGNTVVDALLEVINRQSSVVKQEELGMYFKERWKLVLTDDNQKRILVTGHRRESFGEDFRNICMALKEIAERNPDVTIIYPVHLNPNVQKPVNEILGSNQTTLTDDKEPKNIFLLEPLEYEYFVYLMSKSYIIMTDSGGIQEEAPSLHKPVLVMRNTTERSEGIEANTLRLVGTKKDIISSEAQQLLDNKDVYDKMSRSINPYGDGKAAGRIVDILTKNLMSGGRSKR